MNTPITILPGPEGHGDRRGLAVDAVGHCVYEHISSDYWWSQKDLCDGLWRNFREALGLDEDADVSRRLILAGECEAVKQGWRGDLTDCRAANDDDHTPGGDK